jgi:redox-sensitive bicupin YhaK (pirin superfamily)
MIRVRRAAARGHADHGWLDTYHTFSFADYYDPEHMGFRALRVINEDRVQPGQGFGMHGHRDMEIVTYVLAGALEHRDSLGNGSLLRAGELQRMTAGTGVRHSEFNPSTTEPVHLYQIWLLPERPGLPPSYEQRRFEPESQKSQWLLVASPDGRQGSLTIRQDAELSLAVLEPGQTLTYSLAPGRHGWLQVLRGRVEINGMALEAGDGASLSEEPWVQIASRDAAELLWFDLP